MWGGAGGVRRGDGGRRDRERGGVRAFPIFLPYFDVGGGGSAREGSLLLEVHALPPARQHAPPRHAGARVRENVRTRVRGHRQARAVASTWRKKQDTETACAVASTRTKKQGRCCDPPGPLCDLSLQVLIGEHSSKRLVSAGSLSRRKRGSARNLRADFDAGALRRTHAVVSDVCSFVRH